MMNQKPIDRVKIIIDDNRLSISAFEKEIGHSNNSIQTALKRRSNLKDETLNSILNAFPDYSGLWLLTGKGEKLVENMLRSQEATYNILDSDPQSISIGEQTMEYSKQPSIITVDSHNNDNIVLVPQKLKAGYLQGFNNPTFISKLPTYRMPGLNNGIFRMFQVEGNSMFPTLTNNSYVVGEFVENWITGVKDNRVYVIISNELEDGLIKRCLNRIKKYDNLICKSDNRRNYPTQNIHPSKIKEIWEVKLHLNFDLPDPGDLYDRVNDLEAEVEMMKTQLNKKTKNLE